MSLFRQRRAQKHQRWRRVDPSLFLARESVHSIQTKGRMGRFIVFNNRARVLHQGALWISLHKILLYFKALLWESVILVLPPPTCKAYPISILLHDHCAIYAPPRTPPGYDIHHEILVMAISCKGQTMQVGGGNERMVGSCTTAST